MVRGRRWCSPPKAIPYLDADRAVLRPARSLISGIARPPGCSTSLRHNRRQDPVNCRHLGRGPRRRRRGGRAPPTRRGASWALPGRASSPQTPVCHRRPRCPGAHWEAPCRLPSVSQGPLRRPRRSDGSGRAWGATRGRSAGASGLRRRTCGAVGRLEAGGGCERAGTACSGIQESCRRLPFSPIERFSL